MPTTKRTRWRSVLELIRSPRPERNTYEEEEDGEVMEME
jgi:hypothetical protein